MIYEYYCNRCESRFEISKPMSEASAPADCPSCGNPVRRIFSSLAVVWGDNCWDFDKEGWGNNFVKRHHD